MDKRAPRPLDEIGTLLWVLGAVVLAGSAGYLFGEIIGALFGVGAALVAVGVIVDATGGP